MRCWTTGERERLVWAIFPGCASGRFCFLLCGHRIALSWGNPRQNRERLLQGRRRKRQINPGKDRGREPTQHERQRSGVFGDGSVEHEYWQIETKKWDTDACLCILSHFEAHSRPSHPPKGVLRVFSRVIWLQIQLECRANCGLLYHPTSLSCQCDVVALLLFLSNKIIFSIIAAQLCLLLPAIPPVFVH